MSKTIVGNRRFLHLYNDYHNKFTAIRMYGIDLGEFPGFYYENQTINGYVSCESIEGAEKVLCNDKQCPCGQDLRQWNDYNGLEQFYSKQSVLVCKYPGEENPKHYVWMSVPKEQ